MIIDRAIHFALGCVLSFCGLTLFLPLLIGDLDLSVIGLA
jgi:hypothetical protein